MPSPTLATFSPLACSSPTEPGDTYDGALWIEQNRIEHAVVVFCAGLVVVGVSGLQPGRIIGLGGVYKFEVLAGAEFASGQVKIGNPDAMHRNFIRTAISEQIAHVAGALEQADVAPVADRAQRRFRLAPRRLLLDVGEPDDHLARLHVVVHVERKFQDAAAGLRRQRRLVDRVDDPVPQALLRRRLRLDRQCREGHRRGLARRGRFTAAGSKENGNGQGRRSDQSHVDLT